MGDTRNPLAAILAGGGSKRFGGPKPLSALEGRPLLAWVRDAVEEALPHPVLIANDPEAFRTFGMRVRSDTHAGSGPLGGIHTALLWAREERRPGALCVSCDTPFLRAGLLRRLIDEFHDSDADLVAPESGGPLGVEPLCAIYSVACLEGIERRLRSGDYSLGALLRELRTRRLPFTEVSRHGRPADLFFNVNTREELATAARISRRMRS